MLLGPSNKRSFNETAKDSSATKICEAEALGPGNTNEPKDLKRETPIAATVSPITEYVANALAASATSAIISGLLLCAVAACASKHVMNDAANEPIFTPAFFNDEEEDEEEVDVDDDDDDDEAGAYSTSTDDSFANAKTGPTRRLHAWLFLFFFALKMLLEIFFCCFCALVVVVWVCEESNTKPDEVDIFFVAVERREILIKMRGRRYGGDRGEKEQKRRKKYTDEE